MAVTSLHKVVGGKVRVGWGLSDEVESNIGVKRGCHLSRTLFGVCIAALEPLCRKIEIRWYSIR